MRCRVEVSRPAQRDIDKLEPTVRQRVLKRLVALGDDPRPPDAKKLSGEASGYRIRVGDYRVLYRVDDDVLLVLVVRVGRRREVYRSR